MRCLDVILSLEYTINDVQYVRIKNYNTDIFIEYHDQFCPNKESVIGQLVDNISNTRH